MNQLISQYHAATAAMQAAIDADSATFDAARAVCQFLRDEMNALNVEVVTDSGFSWK